MGACAARSARAAYTRRPGARQMLPLCRAGLIRVATLARQMRPREARREGNNDADGRVRPPPPSHRHPCPASAAGGSRWRSRRARPAGTLRPDRGRAGPGERRRATLRRPRRRHAELVGLLVGALAGWLIVGLAWPQATLRGDTLWLLGVVAGGLAGDGLAQLWRYGAALARRRRRGAGA